MHPADSMGISKYSFQYRKGSFLEHVFRTPLIDAIAQPVIKIRCLSLC